jgi:hypothetical protein
LSVERYELSGVLAGGPLAPLTMSQELSSHARRTVYQGALQLSARWDSVEASAVRGETLDRADRAA